MQHLLPARHHHGTGELLQCAGDAFLPAFGDADEISQPTHRLQGGVPFQASGGIAAIQRVLERVGLGLQRDDPSIHLAPPRLDGVELVLQPGHGLACGVQRRAAVIVHGLRLLLQRLPLAFGLVVLPHQRLALAAKITDSGFGQLHRRFLAGHQLTQIGDLRLTLLRGAAQLVQRLPDRGQPFLAVRTLFRGLVEGQSHIRDRALLILRLGVQFRGALLQDARVLAEVRDDLPGQRPAALPRQLGERVQSLLDARQLVEGLVDAGHGRTGLGAQRLHLFDADLDPGQVVLCGVQLRAHRGQFRTQRFPTFHRLAGVLGVQSRLSVTQADLDAVGPTGDARLSAERTELTANLAEQVVQPGQVGFGVRQLAQRTLLALAVFEDAGRLLDEGAVAARIGLEDGVEAPLAHDDVHLLAQPRIAQQLLDVQQAAWRAVDGVFGAAVAPDRA